MESTRRNESYSLEIASPSKLVTPRHGNAGTVILASNHSSSYSEFTPNRATSHKSSKSSLDTNIILDTVTNAEYIGHEALSTPSKNVLNEFDKFEVSPASMITVCHSDAPQPPSPLPELICHQNDITPAPSPTTKQIIRVNDESNQYPDNQQLDENQGSIRSTPRNIKVADDRNEDENEYKENQVSPNKKSNGSPIEVTYSETPTQNDLSNNSSGTQKTFIIKESEEEFSDMSGTNETYNDFDSITLTYDNTLTHHPIDNTIDNTENINANSMKPNIITPITPPNHDSVEANLNVIDESQMESSDVIIKDKQNKHYTIPSLTELLKNTEITIKNFDDSDDNDDNNDDDNNDNDNDNDDEVSQLTLSESIVASTTLNSVSNSMDIIDNKRNIMPEIKEYFDNKNGNDMNMNEEEEEEISQLSTTLISVSPDNSDDIVLPQVCPSKPEMRAPKPMFNNLAIRRHSYQPCLSRTNLQIDASGDDTTSGSDCNEAMEACSSGNDVLSEDVLSDSHIFDQTNNSSQGSSPSPIKNYGNRSSDYYNELQQRKTAMDSHYIIPFKYKQFICCYFCIFITILMVLIVIIGTLTFDKTPKYVNKLKYDKYSFLKDECRNISNIDVEESYLMDYGDDQFVDREEYKYNDGIHWIILSLISIGGMYLIYIMILFITAGLLIFRHEYYKKHGIDPLFIFVAFVQFINDIQVQMHRNYHQY